VSTGASGVRLREQRPHLSLHPRSVAGARHGQAGHYGLYEVRDLDREFTTGRVRGHARGALHRTSKRLADRVHTCADAARACVRPPFSLEVSRSWPDQARAKSIKLPPFVTRHRQLRWRACQPAFRFGSTPFVKQNRSQQEPRQYGSADPEGVHLLRSA
jgi:hypothetical protein